MIIYLIIIKVFRLTWNMRTMSKHMRVLEDLLYFKDSKAHMAFNFSTAYKKYEQQEAQRRAYYAKLGMSQSDIEAICAFDKKQFLSDCRYQRRMQSLTTEDEFGDERSPLLVRFADVLTVYQTPSMTERFWWVDEIESPELIQKIKKLTLL